jgi:hypothetical protein
MAQPQAKPGRKILRIGIIQNGKIIEERLLRKREPVTVGESHRNTFVISATGLPPRFPLFELKGDKYFLTIAEWMDGRLSLGTGVSDLQGLKQQGVAKKVGQVDYKDPKQPQGSKQKVGVFQVPLSEKSRGKLTFGEVTLLFQFVTPPPLPVKPALPAIIQGGWIKGIDWVYSSILLLSFIAHSGFVYWCQVTGPLPKVALDKIDNRFARLIVQKPMPRPKVKLPPTKEGKDKKGGKKSKKGKKKAVKKAKKPSKRPSSRRPPARRVSAAEMARRRAARRRAIQAQLMRRTVLGLLGAKGAGGTGSPVQDVLSGGNAYSKNLDAALAKSRGVAVAGSGSTRGTRRTGGKSGSLNLKGAQNVGKGLTTGGGGIKGGGGTRRRAATVRGKFTIGDVDTGAGNLDSGALMRLIRRKRRQFKYCYERELKRSPSLRGKLSVRVTVSMRGRASNTEIEENSLNNNVARCIIRGIKRWRFPKPTDGPTNVVIPFVFSPAG